MPRNISVPRSTVNLFFVLLAIVVWGLSYYLLSQGSDTKLSFQQFTAEILKDLGVVIAGLALVDWLWRLFSGDPVEQSLGRLEESIKDAIHIVAHARHSGVVRIDSDPVALDAGFPTDQFRNAQSIDLCGVTLHSLFARGDLTSAMEEAVKRGCRIRVCVASPENSAVLNNSSETARAAMPGQSASVIGAIRSLETSLRTTSNELADRISLYLLQDGVMMASISRIDRKMVVVPYLQSAFTLDSPAMLLEDSGERPLFATYQREFEHLLSVSKRVTDNSHS